MATFYKGQHYRIAICSDESLGKMQFTIRNAKRVLVLDKGKVVQQGSHDELIEQKGLYLDLHQLQLLGDE